MVNEFILGRKRDLNDMDTWKYLVENGADIHINDDAPLKWACVNRHFFIAEYLVQCGAILRTKWWEKTNVSQYQPIIVASENGYLKIVRYLIKSVANRDITRACKNVIKLLSNNGHSWDNYELKFASTNRLSAIGVRMLVEQEINVHIDAILSAFINDHFKVNDMIPNSKYLVYWTPEHHEKFPKLFRQRIKNISINM